ncbi:MAG: NmrA family NAD(P)-binding protein [Nitrosomonas sp.]|nr:NmrA family NAD(P)-binding protein [Nitrosomonas sp.]
MKSRSKVKSVLIFGAKDHIGSVVARYIRDKAPNVLLRVATHKEENIKSLRTMFPDAEHVVADLLDKDSLIAAVKGMEGIFQISPDVFDEDTLVDNMVAACTDNGCVKHIIRVLGTPPGASFSLVPDELKKYRHYPAMQHLVATQRYQETNLPVTFVNVAGYYMDDFIRMFAPSLFEERTIRVAFDKRLAWIDPVDVAEVSAELLLSEPEEYTGKVIDVTGNDLCTISAVADIFTRVLSIKVNYCGDQDKFYTAIKPIFSQLWGKEAPDYFMKYFKWETEHDHMFKLTPHVRNIIKREPKLFASWIDDHRNIFLTRWKENGVDKVMEF